MAHPWVDITSRLNPDCCRAGRGAGGQIGPPHVPRNEGPDEHAVPGRHPSNV